MQGRAPPPGQAQPSGPTKAPQTLRDPGQGALASSGPSSAERTGQQPPRPRRRVAGEQDPCTGVDSPPQLSSDEPLPARVGPCSEDPLQSGDHLQTDKLRGLQSASNFQTRETSGLLPTAALKCSKAAAEVRLLLS